MKSTILDNIVVPMYIISFLLSICPFKNTPFPYYYFFLLKNGILNRIDFFSSAFDATMCTVPRDKRPFFIVRTRGAKVAANIKAIHIIR